MKFGIAYNLAPESPISKLQRLLKDHCRYILELSAVSHSHIPIKHFLKQIETYTPNRGNRDVRPEWVTQLIDNVADLLVPLDGIARVGFDTLPEEELWVVRMYLGTTEIVGGPDDGEYRHVDFEVDLKELTNEFEQIHEIAFRALPGTERDGRFHAQSKLVVHGLVCGNAVRMELCAVPPQEAGPGLKQFADGNFEPF